MYTCTCARYVILQKKKKIPSAISKSNWYVEVTKNYCSCNLKISIRKLSSERFFVFFLKFAQRLAKQT